MKNTLCVACFCTVQLMPSELAQAPNLIVAVYLNGLYPTQPFSYSLGLVSFKPLRTHETVLQPYIWSLVMFRAGHDRTVIRCIAFSSRKSIHAPYSFTMRGNSLFWVLSM